MGMVYGNNGTKAQKNHKNYIFICVCQKKTLSLCANLNTMLKLSVIIPVYNVAPYVRKCVESVLAQDLNPKDYEVILVDDGSTDGSGEICDELAQSTIHNPQSTIHIIHQKNQGVAAARNAGAKVATGEYLAFLDSDDWWAPTYLSRMLWLVTNYPEAGLYACNYWYIKTGKTHVGVEMVSGVRCLVSGEWKAGYINYPKAYYENVGMPVWTGAAVMPHKVFDEVGGFPVGIRLGEDFLLWSKVALRYKVAFLNEALAYYNNDIPAKFRATKKLHAPEYHMLFNMEHLQETEKNDADWKQLCDWLRVNGLMAYWMDKRYHNRAAEELKKVDWNQQPASVKRMYTTPIWVLKAKQRFMQVGSFVKQKIVRLIHKR